MSMNVMCNCVKGFLSRIFNNKKIKINKHILLTFLTCKK